MEAPPFGGASIRRDTKRRSDSPVGARSCIAALLAALCLLWLTPAASGAPYSTIETENLRLVYPGVALEYVAPYTARCFENSMRFQRALWGYRPSEKVNVILDDAGDYGNAGVWVNPRNSMVVHIAPTNFVYETGPSNERVNFTMNHETVHVVALDGASGSDSFARGLFRGKVRETSEHPESIVWSWLCLPRRAAPRWYHEGIATFLETWMAGGLGRAQGPYDEMVFRSMVRDGARFYDPLGLESAGMKVDFQAGAVAYLYGTRFFSYLAWQYSPERLLDWVGREPGSKRDFAGQFEKVFGKPLSAGWRDWISWEQGFQRANLDSLQRFPTTPWRDISRRSLGSVSRPFVDAERSVIYVAAQYPGTVASIVEVSLATGELREIHEVKGPALYFVCSLAWDPKARTLFYTADNNEWRDLWMLDPDTGRARRLIKDARIGDLCVNPADGALWGVRHFNGFSTLVRVPPPYREWTQVVTFPYGLDLYDVDISPDGALLAGSMSEITGRQSLQLFRMETLAAGDSASRMLHDFGSAIPTSFVFTPDGKRLLGSSYYTGVSNIFRYDLDADSMDVVTNAETGFFRPLPAANDSLIVFRYGGEGFVPAWVKAEPLIDVSAITFLGSDLVKKHPVLKSWKAPPPSSVDLDSVTVRSGPYRALRSIGIASVYPIVEGYKDHAAAGFETDVSDPLQLHRLSLSASYSLDEAVTTDERWHVKLQYKRWDVHTTLRWNPASFYDLVGPVKSSRKGYGASLDWERSLLRDAPKHLDLSTGLDGWGGLERLPDNQNVSTSPGFDKLLSGHAQLAYKNLRGSIGAVEFEKGHSWKLLASLDGVRFVRGGKATWRGFPHGVGTLDAGVPGPLKNGSVWLRTAAGYSPGDPEEPFANFFFGGFGNNWLDWRDAKRYRDWSSFPGAGIDAIAGTDFTRALIDVNLPPVRFRRVGTLNLFAAWARLSLFGSGLITNLGHDGLRREVANAGAQVDLRLQLFIMQPLTLSTGYARAFENHRATTDEWMVSLKIL
jgi:Tol biopolymer transport system component